MKNLIVIYLKDDFDKEIPFSREVDRNAFESWQILAEKQGIKMFRASIKWYDEKNKSFSKGWQFNGQKWLKTGKIKPDFIYDRTPSRKDAELYDKKVEMQKNFTFLNNPLFRLCFGNKGSQAIYFKDFMPHTVLASNRSEFEAFIGEIKTDKIVVKPLYGSGGFNILIASKDEALKQLDKIPFPVVIQEMIDASAGMSGISETLSDLRLVFVNHNLTYACSRIAKKGSLFTNFHQGAKMIVVPNEKIPASILQVMPKIQETLKIFKKTDYSLDFLIEKEKPYMIEMNTTPGVDYFSAPDYNIREKYFLAILNSFKN